MPVTREQAFEALSSLKPAEIFLESYEMEILPENMDIYFRPPEEFFMEPEAQEFYTGNHLIPILSSGSSDAVIFLDPATGDLIEKSLETPSEVRITYHGWQQYLASVMLEVCNAIDEMDHIGRIADLIGFLHVDELFAHLRQSGTLQGEQWETAQDEFVAGIPV